MNALLRPVALSLGVALLALVGLGTVAAQFGPPSTVFGSINDEAGPVAEGLKVEAYVGSVECSDGHGRTEKTGDGAARVTVYAVDVVSREQRAGCGTPGAEVRIKIGDRFAPNTTRWSGAGFVRFDITFGNVTPVPIPTFTPTATGPRSPTPVGATSTPIAGAATDTPGGASPTAEGGSTGTPATQAGGVTSSTPGPGVGGGDDEDGGGVPLWAIVLLVLGGIAAAGGGIGYFIARSHAGEAEEDMAAHGPP